MAWAKTPNILPLIFYRLKWKFKTSEKVVFFTFDDGPTPEVTDFVLNILDKYNAKATFFCLGRNVEKYPEIYNRIVLKEHKTGNHTYSHLDGWKTNSKRYMADTNFARTLIKSRLFRPPYGKLRQTQKLKLLKRYKVVMWDVLSYDYDQKTTPEKCLYNVLHHIKKGSIVVFHDSLKAKKNLYYTLPRTLKFLSEEGYKFESIY